jgi:hypothetical protein
MISRINSVCFPKKHLPIGRHMETRRVSFDVRTKFLNKKFVGSEVITAVVMKSTVF